MRHSCLASHLSSESTPLMGMGNVKTSPDDVFERHMFFFCVCHSYSLGGLQVRLKQVVQKSSFLTSEFKF